MSPDASVGYWKVLAPVFAIVCIFSQWSRVPAGGGAKTRLIVVQVLHWGAFLLTILILFLPHVQKTVSSLVSAQIVLYLLALSTFLAGLYSTSWQLVVVGVLMALAVPAIAFLQQTVLLVVVIAAPWPSSSAHSCCAAATPTESNPCAEAIATVGALQLRRICIVPFQRFVRAEHAVPDVERPCRSCGATG